MSLKRKPLNEKNRPDYPQSDEYASDRRGFLAMMGAALVGGVLVYKGSSFGEAGKPTSPTLNGSARTPKPPVSKLPAQPQAAVDGDIGYVNTPAPPVKATPVARPQAALLGDMPGPQALPPVPSVKDIPLAKPQATLLGVMPSPQTLPPTQPQAREMGNVIVPQPIPVAPKAASRGRRRAPTPVPPPKKNVTNSGVEDDF